MMVLERGTLELDFDPNELLVQFAHVMQPQVSTSIVHCGVCIARNKILRAHPTHIHYDEESLDLIDDAAPWNVIHPDEKATRC